VAKVVPIDSPSPVSGSVTVLAVDALLIGPITRWEISMSVEHLDPEGVTPANAHADHEKPGDSVGEIWGTEACRLR